MSYTPRGTRSATSACGHEPAGCCCRGTICCRESPPPVTFARGYGADPLRSYLASLRAVADLRPQTVLPGHGTPFGDPQARIEAILRTKVRRLERIRRAIREQPRSIVELADLLVAKAILAHQRQLAINETLPHVAYLRCSGVVERRTRPDGVYEWYATSDTPLDVTALAAPSPETTGAGAAGQAIAR